MQFLKKVLKLLGVLKVSYYFYECKLKQWDMRTLIEILKEETKSLKIQYVEKTVEWASKQWIRNKIRRDKYFNTSISEYSSKNEYYSEQKFAHNSPSWFFTSEFVDRCKKEAEAHYEKSILKLVDRINKKGLNIDKLTIVTGHVGVNIETLLTDGEKKVKAFTVLAYGPIQRPHYRYLIK